MQLPDDIEQRLIDRQSHRAAVDLANRRKIRFYQAVELINGWLFDRQQGIQGNHFGRRKNHRHW